MPFPQTCFLKIRQGIFFCLHVETKNPELGGKNDSLSYDSETKHYFIYIYINFSRQEALVLLINNTNSAQTTIEN